MLGHAGHVRSPMTDPLPATLCSALQSDWHANPAMRQLVEGYAAFHGTLALTAGALALVLSWAAWRCRRSARVLRGEGSVMRSLEERFLLFATFALSASALFLLVVTAANISNAADPLPGFADAIGSLGSSPQAAALHTAFADWIRSGAQSPPALVEDAIADRRVFHLNRAIASFVALSVLTTCTVMLSRRLSRTGTDTRLVFAGAVVSLVLALLAAMGFCANLQGALVPIANALQFGEAVPA